MDEGRTTQGRPRRRLFALVFALCVLVVIAVAEFWPGAEPEYDGMRLSQWLEVQGNRPTEASDAIRAMGTNALPVLVSWVEYQTPPWRARLAKWYFKFPGFAYNDRLVNFIANERAQSRSYNSVFAFRALGTNAYAAIPELARFVADTRNRNRKPAAQALAYIGGPDALPPLLAALKDQTVPALDRVLIAGAIPYLNYRGPELSNAVPVMIACLGESNRYVPSLAATALGTFLVQPEQCVPALTKAIESPDYRVRRNAMHALGNFGRDATNAINAVSKALEDLNPDVRREATNALQKIAPEVLTNGVKGF